MIWVYITIDMSKLTNVLVKLNIRASYKFVYFYFELLLSTDMYLPMKK